MSANNEPNTFEVPANATLFITAVLRSGELVQVDIYDGNTPLWEPELTRDQPLQTYSCASITGKLQICLMGAPVAVATIAVPDGMKRTEARAGTALNQIQTDGAAVFVNWSWPSATVATPATGA